MRTRVAAIVAAVGLVAGCSTTSHPRSTQPSPTYAPVRTAAPGNASPGLTRFYSQRPTWTACKGHPAFQCTTIQVPLNYDQPTGTTIELAVNKLPATGTRRRLGSLLTNPGGPGGSGLDYTYSVGQKGITPDVRASYDLIGIDPRGVGQSAPVKCLSDAGQDAFYAHELDPTTPEQEAALRTASQQYADACEKTSGSVLPYVGTVNAARDMDVVRAVLGDDKLNYLGISYGTELGQVYAQLFPAFVGRMVLDSVVDTDLSPTESGVTQMKGVQRAFDAFVDNCVTMTTCPLGGPGTSHAAAVQKLTDLLARMVSHPLPGQNGRVVNDSDARTALVEATYDPSFWQYARQGLTLAFQGDGSGLQLLADAYRERSQNGTYSNLQPANLVIGCLETPVADRSEQATQAELAAMAKASPLLGGIDTGLPCAYLKLPYDALPSKVTAPGAPPILLLNNLGDNATPIEWARAVAGRLSGSVLVTNNESGHGVYGRGGCVNNAVDGFLVDGRLPAQGTTCDDRGSLS